MILAFGDGWGLAGALAATASYAALALASFRRQTLAEASLPDTPAPRVPRLLLALAWLLHGAVLAEGLLGTPARFGFGPALSVTVWLVLTVYAIESRLFPKLPAHWALAALGGAAVLVGLAFPGAAYHAIASPWLPVHWALGLASYGLFAAAVVHGWLMTRAERAMRRATQQEAAMPLMTLERLTFRFVEAGFALLSATLLVGWLFAEQLYGPRLTGMWNHKTVFSVLAWLTFALLLVGRARLGWRGGKAVRVLYLGSGLLLLGYAGSRFVFEVVLGRV